LRDSPPDEINDPKKAGKFKKYANLDFEDGVTKVGVEVS